MQYGSLVLLLVAGCGAVATPPALANGARTDQATRVDTSGAESLELRADLTTPAELRARVDRSLERPALARIEGAPSASWIFAPGPGDVRPEESRPALDDPSSEPHEYRGSVTSDPVGRELITTIAEADVRGARLRYVPK